MPALARHRDPDARQETWAHLLRRRARRHEDASAGASLSAASAGGGVIQPILGLFVGPTRDGEARGGRHTLARIGVMRALNREVKRVFNPDRKDTRWESGN